MIRLIYTGTARPDTAKAAVLALVDKASAFSRATQISGLLVVNGQHFVQVLEGEEEAVFALFERLATDPSHDGLLVIGNEEIAARAFMGWDFCFTRAPVSGVVPTNNVIVEAPRVPSHVRQIFAKFGALDPLGDAADLRLLAAAQTRDVGLMLPHQEHSHDRGEHGHRDLAKTGKQERRYDA